MIGFVCAGDFEEIEGKTIEKAVSPGWGERAFVFTDGSWLFLKGEYEGEDALIKTVTEPNLRQQLGAGILSQDEYEDIRRKEDKERREKVKEYELETLERLKAKYEGKE